MRFIPVLLALLSTCLASQASLADSPAPPAASAATAAPAAAPAGGIDHAAKHAKLTACRDQARAKKLIGAEKKAFIAHCVATS